MRLRNGKVSGSRKLTFTVARVLQRLCEIWERKMQVYRNKESQSCKYRLKCHYKCLCFDQLLHICLFQKKKKMQLTALFAAPQWLEGERRKKGDSDSNSDQSRANQLFTLERQMACFHHKMSIF